MVFKKGVIENVHVLPLGAVLLKSFAFSMAALPRKKNKHFHNVRKRKNADSV